LTLAGCTQGKLIKLLCLSPPQQDRGEENKMKKNSWHKGSLINKKQRSCAEVKTFSTSHQKDMLNHCLGSRTSVHVVLSPEVKYLNDEYPLLFFLLAFAAEQISYGMKYLFSQPGSDVLTMCPFNLLPLSSPSLPAFGKRNDVGGWVERQTMSWELSSAIEKMLVCCQHCSSYKLQRYEGCCAKLTASQPDLIQ